MTAAEIAAEASSPRRGGEVHLDEWVAPEVADERGYLRAGKILEWMDVVGVLAASRHCRLPVVTASVDGMALRDPIRVGARLTMTAAIAYTSERSIGVSVSMVHGLPSEERGRHVLSAYMSFVAVDDAGKALRIPAFVPETPAEVARFREGRLRREFRRRLVAGQRPILPAPSAQAPDRATALYIREFLKVLPRAIRLPWDRGDAHPPQDRGGSYVHKVELVRAGKLNFHGTLYGGTLMRWIEGAGSLSASAYMKGAPVRLIGLHGLTFLRPVPPNRFVHIRAVVVHTGGTHLTVLVDVQAEEPLSGAHEETLRAFLTYAPLERSVAAAELVCTSDEERALFEEVEHRLALQARVEPELGMR